MMEPEKPTILYRAAQTYESLTLLYLEDDRELNERITRLLTKKGFKVISCSNSMDAQESLAIHEVDVVLADVVGPSFIFEEFIRESAEKGIPIVFLTGAYWKDLPQIEGAKIIGKGVGQEIIFNAIDKVLEQKRKQEKDHRPTLLYIEDKEDALRIFSDLFRNRGFNVFAFSHPNEAKETVRSEKIDVVVTDVAGFGSRSHLENLLEECNGKAIGIIIWTGAIYNDIIPKIEGARIVKKPGFEKILTAINEVLEEKRFGRIRVLLVDDDWIYTRVITDALRSDCEICSCSDPIKAKNLVQNEGFDLIISDIVFNHGILQRDVEEFLRLCTDLGIPIIVSSNGEWNDTQKFPGVRLVEKCQPPKRYLQALREAARDGEKKRARIPDEIIHRIANPDKHIETPIEKWERVLMEGGQDSREMDCLSHHMELQSTRQMMDKAFRHGDWPKRDLDELMRKRIKFKGKPDHPRKAKKQIVG